MDSSPGWTPLLQVSPSEPPPNVSSHSQSYNSHTTDTELTQADGESVRVTMTTCGRRRDVLPGLGDRGLRSRRGGGCHLHGDRGTRMKVRGHPGSAALRLKTSPETPPEDSSRRREEVEEERGRAERRWRRGGDRKQHQLMRGQTLTSSTRLV